MRYLKYAALLGILLFFVATSNASAQVRVGVAIGPAPVCAYGYYGYYPYACAPYGYYGPSYFLNGVFVGAGPWYHTYYGPRRFDRDDYRGYRGYYGHPDRDNWRDHDDHGYRGYEGHESHGHGEGHFDRGFHGERHR